jgi:hypothetical protein
MDGVRTLEIVEPTTLTDAELGAILVKLSALKGMEKGMEEEAFKRAMNGAKIPGKKLVNKKANRVWKDNAESMAGLTFEEKDLYTEPDFKGPASIEKLPGGKAFVARYAMTPVLGLTLADEGDKRLEAKPLMVQYLEEQGNTVDNPSC